jgi:microcystin degradation protein MlrC
MDQFLASGVFMGDDIRARYGESQSTMAGFLDVESSAVRVEPLIFSFPNPGGPITRNAFERLSHEALGLLDANGPWDGVLLAQHGAAVADHLADADAEFTSRVRQLVGSLPIGVALDLHGNLATRLLANSDIAVGYRTNPHRDARTRARECAELIVRLARKEIRPTQAAVKVALVPNILCQNTDQEPLAHVYAAIDEILARNGMLSASIFQGYPYADVEDLGMTCLAIHDGDQSSAIHAAADLATLVWSVRAGLDALAVPPHEAVSQAARSTRSPVILLDVGDNIGAGSAGDSTILLRLALGEGIASFLQTICAPKAVAQCQDAGHHGRLSLSLGLGNYSSDDRLTVVTGTVIALHEGPFEDPHPTHGGFRHFDPGPTAAFQCDEGPTLVFHSKLIQNVSLNEYAVLGIDPGSYQIVVAKGVNAPQLAYARIAGLFLLADTSGPTSAELKKFAYKHRPKPLFPFEQEISVPFAEWRSESAQDRSPLPGRHDVAEH